MKKICSLTCQLLACPTSVLAGITIISFLALATALTSEVAFGLEPCIMCIYQRIPFAVVIVLSLIGLAVRKKTQIARGLIALSGIAFLVNAGIALYHTGIERKWWASAVEGCSVKFEAGNPQTLLENILSAPTASCTEIAWADPVLGLSMANYNVILCLGLFVVCALSVIRLCPTRSGHPAP